MPAPRLEITASPAEARSTVKGRALPLLVALVAVAVVSGVLGAVFAGPDLPGETSAEAGFGRDMSVHHAQAVDMAMAVRDLSTDPELRTLALDIALTQQNQIGRMQGWLIQWGLPQTGLRPPMAWTTAHGGHPAAAPAAARMPGMATTEDLRRLRSAKGRPAEIQFLTLMVRHHRAGIAMARAVLSATRRTDVRDLAQSILDGQRSEITTLQRMLTDRGANPA